MNELVLKSGQAGKPLVVDLDGTLVKSDLLIETAFAELGRRPQAAWSIAATLMKGKAALKHRLALAESFDPPPCPTTPPSCR